MAQIGSFVPARSAQIGIVDAIFTRVGASDDLASGKSTFMVEMSEVADIIKYATKNSLLILDEIGRGTSTYDGMSIARAVLEYVADKKKLGAKALFATHYHELTELEHEFQGVKNYNIAVKKRGDDIIFLRRIVRGGADESYGIEVAKLSGIPDAVIVRAKEILKKTLEEGIVTYKTVKDSDMQLPLEMMGATEILQELKNIDVNTLTPIEAMGILFDIANKAKSF
jgi:DNA mismatch repair protein MutS